MNCGFGGAGSADMGTVGVVVQRFAPRPAPREGPLNGDWERMGESGLDQARGAASTPARERAEPAKF
jgi:hypothetical protein